VKEIYFGVDFLAGYSKQIAKIGFEMKIQLSAQCECSHLGPTAQATTLGP
jgi:hypothetical protein